MIWGVKLAPTEEGNQSPMLSIAIFDECFPAEGSRILAFFADEKSITGEEPADEMGFGDKVCFTDPSGAYFLGRPLFFFIDNGITPNGGGAAVD